MPIYDDPRIYEIITPMQMNALQDLGYMLVREREVRDVVLYDVWLDELLTNMLEKRFEQHPNDGGIYHLRHRLQIIDGVYVDPDRNTSNYRVWEDK